MSGWMEERRELPDGGSIWSRGRRQNLPGGLWWLEQDVRCRGKQVGPFPMAAGWIIEFIEVRRGTLAFRRDNDLKPVPWRRFVWVLPAFSVVHMDWTDVELRFVAVAGEGRHGTPAAASGAIGSQIFPLRGGLPADAGSALRRLSTLDDGVQVEISSSFSPLVRRAKRWLDQHYRERASIAQLANAVGVSHAHLSREFRRALGMSPLGYLHHLRSGEALAKLASGERIVDASLDVGYSDLSRFYKQFHRLGCSAPGRYRERTGRASRRTP
ncbi:MAG TPA: AraC family transcriptional regulator [Vicinamibacterales bacterium]|nr:AraC family transcriptional regulator [Vicinamibacterales bacterium]